MENIYNIFFYFWVFYCLAFWTAQTLLVRKIKKNHHKKWVSLGKPMEVHKFFLACIIPSGRNAFGGDPSLLINTYRSSILLLKYYFKGDLELDADGKVLKLKKINQALLVIGVTIFSGGIVLTLIGK